MVANKFIATTFRKANAPMADTPNWDKRTPKRITKRQVDALKPGDSILWDGAVKRFGVRCQRSAKVYIL